MQGYNVKLKIGTGSSTKTLLGVTQDSLAIAAKIKESITKDDAGVTQLSVRGHDVTLKTTFLAKIDSSETATALDRDDVIAMALTTGSSASYDGSYEMTGGQKYGGDCVITNFTEDSDASEDGDVSCTVDVRFIEFAAVQ